MCDGDIERLVELFYPKTSSTVYLAPFALLLRSPPQLRCPVRLQATTTHQPQVTLWALQLPTNAITDGTGSPVSMIGCAPRG